MFQYRQVLVRLRQGDTDREIARAGLMGRPKAARLRVLAADQGWLDPEAPLPEDAAIAAVVGAARRARSTISSVEPYRALVERWAASEVSGVVIHAALCREHGYSGSYSSVYRMLTRIAASRPPRDDRPAQLRARGGRPGRLRRRPGAHRPGGGRAATHLVLRDDAGLVAPPVRRVRLGPDGGHLAGLSPPRLRVVRRRARAADHRQPQVRDHPRLQSRPAGAARLRRMRRGLRLPDRSVSAADPQKKGIVEAGVKYVKRNFLPLREFRDLADLNAQARAG